VPMDMS